MTETKINITPETRVAELLENYPELEDLLVSLSPAFSKLKNPLLRRTVAKITSLQQAAAVGNISIGKVVNTLRQAAGMELTDLIDEKNISYSDEISQKGFDIVKYDAREDLSIGVHPLGKVMSALHHLEKNQKYLLVTPFIPAPLIDKAKEKGFTVSVVKKSDELIETYFTRNV